MTAAPPVITDASNLPHVPPPSQPSRIDGGTPCIMWLLSHQAGGTCGYGEATLFAGDDDGYRFLGESEPAGLRGQRLWSRDVTSPPWRLLSLLSGFPERPATADYPKLGGASLKSFCPIDIANVVRCSHCDV